MNIASTEIDTNKEHKMTIPEIQEMADAVERLTSHGLHDSASRVVSDTVRNLLVGPFELDDTIEYLTHYTTVDTLFSMLSCSEATNERFALSSSGPTEELDENSGFLRMYDTYNSNDPQEGQFLLSSKPKRHRFPSTHSNMWELLADRARLPAYVTSFRALSKIEEVDDLVFWRTYGKEGQGCAIVFPRTFLDTTTPILQVKYGRKAVRSTLDRLLNVFDALASAKSLEKIEPPEPQIPRYVSASLSPIPYLHKSDDYKFEREVRVVAPFVDLSPRALFCHRIQDPKAGVKLRHFANHPDLHVRNILKTDSIIVLGPAVRGRDNVAFVLKRRLVNIGLVGTKVCGSKIVFRS